MTEYLVQLQDDCWIAPWSGDPGRTLSIDHARVFDTPQEAANSLRYAKRFRDFAESKIIVRKDGQILDYSAFVKNQ